MYCPVALTRTARHKVLHSLRTNLGLVSEALGRKPSAALISTSVWPGDQGLLHGRRDTITGIVCCRLRSRRWRADPVRCVSGRFFLIFSWMIFWGISALASGLGKWVAASGELKALGYKPPSSKLWIRLQKLLSRADTALPTNSLTERAEIPASVTEHTTRELEARARVTPLERQ